MKISICMATYNGRVFIAEQIHSIIDQMRDDDDLIIGDDGSSDGTVDYIEGLRDERVRIHVNKARLGHVKNFESCLQRSTGDIIVFADQDDVWASAKLQWTRALFFENPTITLANHALHLVNSEGRSLGRTFRHRRLGVQSNGRFLLQQFIKREIFGAASALRRSTLSYVLPFPSTAYAHDHWLAISNAVCGSVFLSNDELVFYRQHERNMTPRSGTSIWKRLELRTKFAAMVCTAFTRAGPECSSR